MAMMMSLSESLMDVAPGGGILLGGAMAALTGPRIALAVAAGGALAVAGAAWIVLTPRLLRTGDDGAHADELGLARPEAAARRSSQARATPR